MHRPLLILDLDETLLHATEHPLPIQHDFRCGSYFIHKRPFVHEFLDVCAGSYDLSVWTSSTVTYARCIQTMLFDGVPLEFLWARDRCTLRFDPDWGVHYWAKDLKKVKRAGYDLERVLMVDDTPKKLERNYGNLVVVTEFTGDPKDRELLRLAPYLESLAGRPDLRRIEKRSWKTTSG